MLENLSNLVRQYAGDSVINNPAIPNEKNDEVVQEATNSIKGGLQDAVSKGNLSDIMGFFNSGGDNVESNALTQNIKGGFVQNLMQKFGLDQGKAMQIASSLIPMVMQQFAKKTKDPGDNSFDLQDILGKLGGGSGIGKDILGKLGGGEKEGDDGLMGKVKGLF